MIKITINHKKNCVKEFAFKPTVYIYEQSAGFFTIFGKNMLEITKANVIFK